VYGRERRVAHETLLLTTVMVRTVNTLARDISARREE
jgi:hypothetical protein